MNLHTVQSFIQNKCDWNNIRERKIFTTEIAIVVAKKVIRSNFRVSNWALVKEEKMGEKYERKRLIKVLPLLIGSVKRGF